MNRIIMLNHLRVVIDDRVTTKQLMLIGGLKKTVKQNDKIVGGLLHFVHLIGKLHLWKMMVGKHVALDIIASVDFVIMEWIFETVKDVMTQLKS